MTRRLLIVVSNNACCPRCCHRGHGLVNCCVAHKGRSSPPPVPPNLVFIAIALFVAIAVHLPITLVAVALALPPSPSSLPATLIVVSIALATLALALFVTLQSCHRHHCPRITVALTITLGVVQAWVGQKRLNSYILSLFCDVR
jgi:hypothetical protein